MVLDWPLALQARSVLVLATAVRGSQCIGAVVPQHSLFSQHSLPLAGNFVSLLIRYDGIHGMNRKRKPPNIIRIDRGK